MADGESRPTKTLYDAARDGRYVVIWSGDGPSARLFDGWAAMVAAIKADISDGDEAPDYWPEMEQEMEDEDSWIRSDFGRFHYRTEIGDGGFLSVYRLDD